jgi:hypothetical protein
MDSSVGIAAGYKLDDPGSIPASANLILLHSVQMDEGTVTSRVSANNFLVEVSPLTVLREYDL